MFCPNCGKNNKDNVAFCAFCGKALPEKNVASAVVAPPPEVRPFVQTNSFAQERATDKTGVSRKAKTAVTVALIAALVIGVLLIYYPNVFPWNW